MIDLKVNLCSRELRILSEPDRLHIIQFLSQNPRTVSKLAGLLKKHIVRVSRHLLILRSAGVVNDEKKGRFVIYRLSPSFDEPAVNDGPDHLNLGCCRLELPRI